MPICLPVAKREFGTEAGPALGGRTLGNPKFFLAAGFSGPTPRSAKESACGCLRRHLQCPHALESLAQVVLSRKAPWIVSKLRFGSSAPLLRPDAQTPGNWWKLRVCPLECAQQLDSDNGEGAANGVPFSGRRETCLAAGGLLIHRHGRVVHRQIRRAAVHSCNWRRPGGMEHLDDDRC